MWGKDNGMERRHGERWCLLPNRKRGGLQRKPDSTAVDDEREWPESASKLSINRYRHSNFLARPMILKTTIFYFSFLFILQADWGFPQLKKKDYSNIWQRWTSIFHGRCWLTSRQVVVQVFVACRTRLFSLETTYILLNNRRRPIGGSKFIHRLHPMSSRQQAPLVFLTLLLKIKNNNKLTLPTTLFDRNALSESLPKKPCETLTTAFFPTEVMMLKANCQTKSIRYTGTFFSLFQFDEIRCRNVRQVCFSHAGYA